MTILYLPILLHFLIGSPMELADDRLPLLWGATAIPYCRPAIGPMEPAVAFDCLTDTTRKGGDGSAIGWEKAPIPPPAVVTRRDAQ